MWFRKAKPSASSGDPGPIYSHHLAAVAPLKAPAALVEQAVMRSAHQQKIGFSGAPSMGPGVVWWTSHQPAGRSHPGNRQRLSGTLRRSGGDAVRMVRPQSSGSPASSTTIGVSVASQAMRCTVSGGTG